MNAFREQCITLRKQGLSLTEISKLTGRAKTSVYSHISDLPLSLERIKSIRIASGDRARKLALSRKGKSKRAFSPITWSEKTVSLVAHLIFDGEINSRGCSYNNRNTALILGVESCMSHVYIFKPKRYKNSFTGVRRISYFNVALASHIKDKSAELLKEIYDYPIAYKKVFLKAFFDDEGCIDYRPERNLRQIRGYQKNVQILNIIHKLLEELTIKSRIILPNEVVIVGKENLKKFQNHVGFSQGVKLNGNRTNSIWKKSLEKRFLLEQAIQSFKV